jgi:surface protein
MTLLVLAAGMGSRFGGIKQLTPLTSEGEYIIDFTVYDAVRAEFNNIIFIIRKDIEDIFEERIGARLRKNGVKFSYAYQERELPEGLLTVGNYAFAGCVALTSVTFPSTMKDYDGAPAIGEGAFYGCTSLTAIDLSKTSAVTVGDNAFAGCTALTKITFPTSLKTIGEYAFGACSALTAITIPEGVTTVGAQAFYDCTSVASLTLPASLTNIGDWAFNPVARVLEDSAISVPEGSYAQSYLKALR